MSQMNTSYDDGDEEPVPYTPGGRPLSGAAMDLPYAAGDPSVFGVPRQSAANYGPDIEGDPDSSMDRGGNRDSLRAMGAMMKPGPPPPKDTSKRASGSRFPKPPSIDVRSSFRKMKGVFKRGKKDEEPLQHAGSNRSLEIFDQHVMPELHPQPHTSGAMIEETPPGSGYATPMQFDPHPGGYDLNPTDTLPRKAEPTGRMGSMKHSVKNWFYPSVPSAPPTRTTSGDVAELKPFPGKYPIRMSTIIYFLLVLGIVIGIILTASSSQGQNYAVMGPIILGLSVFALIGKIFFTMVWIEEPCPRLSPYIRKIEDLIGGARDPYRLKQPIQSPNMFMPSMSPTAKDALAMSQFTYVYPDMAAQPAAPGYSGYPEPASQYPQQYEFTYPSAPAPEEEQPYTYEEKVPIQSTGETLDTKMRSGVSSEHFAQEYDGSELSGGYTGPAGRSTPTYLN